MHLKVHINQGSNQQLWMEHFIPLRFSWPLSHQGTLNFLVKKQEPHVGTKKTTILQQVQCLLAAINLATMNYDYNVPKATKYPINQATAGMSAFSWGCHLSRALWLQAINTVTVMQKLDRCEGIYYGKSHWNALVYSELPIIIFILLTSKTIHHSDQTVLLSLI